MKGNGNYLTLLHRKQGRCRLPLAISANACYYLACKLGRNNTATEDKWAFRLCNVAAMQGFSLAQHHLGRLLHRGVGVARDLAKARVFYSLATQQGCDGAREDLELTKTSFRTLV
jgi:TPR repeat protein